jgi:hypothetical protein
MRRDHIRFPTPGPATEPGTAPSKLNETKFVESFTGRMRDTLVSLWSRLDEGQRSRHDLLIRN